MAWRNTTCFFMGIVKCKCVSNIICTCSPSFICQLLLLFSMLSLFSPYHCNLAFRNWKQRKYISCSTSWRLLSWSIFTRTHQPGVDKGGPSISQSHFFKAGCFAQCSKHGREILSFLESWSIGICLLERYFSHGPMYRKRSWSFLLQRQHAFKSQDA